MTVKRAFTSLAALGILVACPYASVAQTSNDPHAGHHAPAQAETQPSIPAQIPGRATGMMGGRMMMGGGMMRQGGHGPAMPLDHVEGRIAFLKAELRITDAQNGVWTAFADALRGSAKQMVELRVSLGKPPAAPGFAERLAMAEKGLSVRLENTRAIRASFIALDAKLTSEQKKMADELLASPMGLGGMMAMGERQ